LELHHNFVFKRRVKGLGEGVFKLSLVSTPKRCVTIGCQDPNRGLREARVCLWNQFSISQTVSMFWPQVRWDNFVKDQSLHMRYCRLWSSEFFTVLFINGTLKG